MGRIFHPTTIVAILISLICGFLHALPYAQGLPSPGLLDSAALGLAAEARSFRDSFNGWLWETGGAARLLQGQWLLHFLTATIVAGLAFVVVGFIARRTHRFRKTLLTGSAVLVLATGLPALRVTFADLPPPIQDLNLVAPVNLIAAIPEGNPNTIFATESGRRSLWLFAPEKARHLTKESSALAADPGAWRAALREHNWQSALLTGPLAENRLLLQHLATSPDWQLAIIDNQGFLFLRGSGPAAPSPKPEEIVLSTDHESALQLAQMATRLDAIQRSPDALACLNQALRLAPDDSTVQSHAATLAASHRRWQDAITHASPAIAANRNATQARIVRALAQYEIGDAAKAREGIDTVLRSVPDDPYSLFLKARICRALNDNAGEARTLERLVALSQKNGQPALHYRIYLGQAYARLGRNPEALRAYQAVLAENRLNPEQTEAIKEAMAAIESGEPAPK